jgi:signal transduction histidine kinase
MRDLNKLLDQKVAALTGELVRREQEARKLLEDLQAANSRIAEQARTLQAANKKLQEMAALKDEFVAKASHELRTPLTSIKEGLSLLIDRALGPTTAEQQDFLKTMDADIDRLTELINNMLDIAKIEAGRMRLLRTRIELAPVLQSLIRSYQPIAGKRHLAVERNGAVPPVFADSNRLLQVLTNLLSNAMKFTPEDGRITFRLGQEDGMVSIAVQDSGTGISQEDLGKLFQKFSQVGSHPSGQPRGTGLGLVVCKELIELHGGRIDVSSEIGRGTTFTIRLPVYSDTFAITECFEEQAAVSGANEGRVPVMVVIDAAHWLGDQQAGTERAAALARLAVAVRQCLHRGDSVLSLEGSAIAVIAAADRDGAGAIVRRLQDKLPESHRLRFGAAMPPQDGADAISLLRRATERLSHDPAQVLQ